jgi:LmbE family N-acetylglucosaminyl deacetylase
MKAYFPAFFLLVGLPVLFNNSGILLAPTALRPTRSNGILVFGPHPDDAELCCSGVMLQAKARGEEVHVVILTNGDAYTEAAAGLTGKPADEVAAKDYLALSRSRQLQSQRSLAVLGLKPSALILLGYPNGGVDGGLDAIYHGTGAVPFTNPFTQKSETYAFVQQDYHTANHGSAAPYTREAVLDDIAEIIRIFKPSQIYVTTGADGHPDHSTAFFFVRDAILKTGFHGEFYTYLIHAGEGLQWPWPSGVTPNLPFEPPHGENQRAGFTLPWPPEKRIFITAAQAHLKLLAIRCHKLTMLDATVDAAHEAYMESFVKSDEVFWQPALK